MAHPDAFESSAESLGREERGLTCVEGIQTLCPVPSLDTSLLCSNLVYSRVQSD